MRARNIKPGFFKNEELAEVDPLIRILFAGLWCYADKEGRFEWRPKRIKAEILPYDNGEITVMLQTLIDHGFIKRYVVEGNEYGWIIKFKENQNPHHTEKASILPPYNLNGEITGNSPLDNGHNPSDSLIPDSLIPDINTLTGICPQDADDSDDPPEEKPKTPPCPHQEIIKLYHEILSELREVKVWNATRKKLLAARWREDKARQNLDWWEKYFRYVKKCSFLMGQVSNRDGPPFEADLEWLVRPQNFAKVIEGKYERRN